MTTQTINSELTLDQLDEVSGGVPPLAAAAVVAGVVVGGTAAYVVSKSLGKAAKALSSGVMAQEDGTDCTGYNPNDPMNPKF